MAEVRTAGIACLAVLFVAGSAMAQTDPAPAISAALKSRTAQRFIDRRLEVWRQRLSLETWQISAVMVRRNNLPPQTLGGIHWDKEKRSAVVWVLDSSDYQLPFDQMLDDMEQTIVHELVHLDLAFVSGGTSRISEELAVDGIAQAMLDQDRLMQQDRERE